MRTTVPLLLALLLVVPAHAAGAVDLRGEITASSLDGEADVEGPAVFFGVLAVDVDAGLEVRAASAEVVVHRRAYSMPPGDAEVNLALGGETTDEPVHHVAVEADWLRVGVESFLMADGTDPEGASTFTAALRALSVHPREDVRFERTTDTGAYWQPHRQGAWPNLEAVGDGSVVLRGDLVLSFFDVDLRVQDPDGETVYRTGRVPDEDADGPTQEGEFRRANVTLHDAEVTYRSTGRPHQANLLEAVASGDGALSLPHATGRLRVGGTDVEVQEALRLEADWSAPLVREDGRLAVALEGSARSVVVDGAPVDLATVAPASPASSSRWRWLAPLLVLPLALWVVHLLRARRLGPDTLVLAADEDLDAGRHRRAEAWSRRALRREPGDADAAAIHVVSLYRRGLHARGVAWLEAWLDLHDDATGELTVLLGLGQLETEGARAAARTLRPALVADPGLRGVLEVDGLA